MDDVANLVDRVYEAAVIPELWTDVCVGLAAAVDAYSAAILTYDAAQSLRWVCSPNIDEAVGRYSTSEIRFQNPRPERRLGFFRSLSPATSTS